MKKYEIEILPPFRTDNINEEVIRQTLEHLKSNDEKPNKSWDYTIEEINYVLDVLIGNKVIVMNTTANQKIYRVK